jgi:hypothetical protein
MDQATHSKIVSFLWGIADDVLRDLFKRGKMDADPLHGRAEGLLEELISEPRASASGVSK